MADLHPLVHDLLDPIRLSEARALYDIAVGRIDAAEGTPEPIADDAAAGRPDEERDPYAPLPGESDGDRARRQVKAADAAISGLLRRELALIERSRTLLSEFNDLSPDRERTSLKGITLIPGKPGMDTIEEVHDTGRLAFGTEVFPTARGEALTTMLTVWNMAVDETLGRIDGDAEPLA